MIDADEYIMLMEGVTQALVTSKIESLDSVALTWYATRPEADCEHVDVLGMLRGRLLDWSPANLECIHKCEILHYRIPFTVMVECGPKGDKVYDHIASGQAEKEVDSNGKVLLASSVEMRFEPTFNPREVISRFVFEAVFDDLLHDLDITVGGKMRRIASGGAGRSRVDNDLAATIAKARAELDKMFPTYEPEGGET